MKEWSLKERAAQSCPGHDEQRSPRPRGQTGPFPQPINEPGVQRREGDIEQEQLDAAREWLRHVEAGRIG